MAQVDLPLAQELARGYVAQLQEDDFRKGPEHGAPWECRHADGEHRQNSVYLTIVACPLAAFHRIETGCQKSAVSRPSFRNLIFPGWWGVLSYGYTLHTCAAWPRANHFLELTEP